MASATGAEQRLSPVRRLAKDPLARGSFGLILASVTANTLGFLFWFVAAKVMDVSEVGRASAATTSMNLAATATSAGVGAVLLHRLVNAGPQARAVFRRAALWAVSLSAGVAAGLSVAVNHDSVLLAVLAVSGAALTGWCLVADAAATATRSTGLVAARNLAGGASRLGLLLACSFALKGPPAVVGAWVGALAVVSVGQWLVLRVRLDALAAHPHRATPTRRFEALWYHAATLGLQLPSLALPLVVSSVLGASAAGRFYVAWYVGAALFMFAPMVANVVLSESVRPGARVDRLLWRGVKMSAVLFVPPALVLAAAAPFVLAVVGAEYRPAASLLTALALSVLPVALNSLAVTFWRLRGQLARAAAVTMTTGVGTVLASWALFARGSSVAAAGWVWLALQVTVAAYSALELRRGVRSAAGVASVRTPG